MTPAGTPELIRYAGVVVGATEVYSQALPLLDAGPAGVAGAELVVIAVLRVVEGLSPPPSIQAVHQGILQALRELLAEVVRLRATGVAWAEADLTAVDEQIVAVQTEAARLSAALSNGAAEGDIAAEGA